MQKKISKLMEAGGVPGLSIFVMRDGLMEYGAFGVRNVDTGLHVDIQTVFEAASLSKPVVAHAVLQLVDAGKLDLDEPLVSITNAKIVDDPAFATITARHVLSHTAGLPNWRNDDYPLRTYFPPGARFSYSGEGFAYLQSALERLTGEPLNTILQRLVFSPLGMDTSSFVWRDTFDANAAFSHNWEGEVGCKFKPQRANAAFSLHTTALDYGRFMVDVVGRGLLSERASQLWLEPQIPTPRGCIQALESVHYELQAGVFWGLGWGLEPHANVIFHWGANTGATAFVLAVPERQTALAVFMNSDRGLDIVPGIVDYLIPGHHPSLDWLGLSGNW
ncbi:beta-lactamase family protein [Ensifer sp. ENS09]|uniref:serine hydrolase domain-containing protein n=1 Tax=Ensifer sp. ENS09 TaxID=2769263 RepID=UPI00177AE24B|nr:beta-lactamase family protein [Ensifer sp. ENS09]